jgi:hypothetical protein
MSTRDDVLTSGGFTRHPEGKRRISQSKIELHRLESVINRLFERSLASLGMTADFARIR